MYKLIIKLQRVKANQILYRTPKNPQKEIFFTVFFQKARAWLSTPTSKCHNVLIGNQKATTPGKQKSKNTKHNEAHKNTKQDSKIKKLTQTI